MLKLNKMTDYAVVILSHMARLPDARANVASLAAATSVPEPAAAKILKDLVRAGLVESFRGAAGGYRLVRGGDAITVRQVVEAVEGPITLVDCTDGASACCATQKQCPLRGKWGPVNDAIIAALDNVTLHDMMARPRPITIAQSA
jgi:FeS assembly SUF system regulator